MLDLLVGDIVVIQDAISPRQYIGTYIGNTYNKREDRQYLTILDAFAFAHRRPLVRNGIFRCCSVGGAISAFVGRSHYPAPSVGMCVRRSDVPAKSQHSFSYQCTYNTEGWLIAVDRKELSVAAMKAARSESSRANISKLIDKLSTSAADAASCRLPGILCSSPDGTIIVNHKIKALFNWGARFSPASEIQSRLVHLDEKEAVIEYSKPVGDHSFDGLSRSRYCRCINTSDVLSPELCDLSGILPTTHELMLENSFYNRP